VSTRDDARPPLLGLVELDWLTVGHVRVALDRYLNRLDARREPIPAGVEALRAQLADWSSGQERTTARSNGAPLVQLLTFGGVARLLGVSERTVRRRVNTGDLPAVHVGPRARRIDSRALAEYVGRRDEKETA
jgi:excisionase family DNA binding protein